MRQEIIIAGFGGQGVMLAGKILAQAAMLEGKHVTYFPSYGAEVRGGTANATIVISDEEIPCPVSSHPDVLLAMNEPSCNKFGLRLKNKGTLIANTSIIKNVFRRKDLKIIEIPATALAHELGSSRSANMVMLGAYLKYKAAVSLKSVEKSIRILLSEKKEQAVKGLWDINIKALYSGKKFK